MRFCDCGRNHFDPVHKGFGDLLFCSLCNGFLLCDFCKDVELDSPLMSIAKFSIGESHTCWHHAWVGVAKVIHSVEKLAEFPVLCRPPFMAHSASPRNQIPNCTAERHNWTFAPSGVARRRRGSRVNRMKTTPETRERIPKTVWELGFVSMFMDISSEMIHSLLPLFLRSVLGASATAIGALEGTAESAVLVAKMFSGALSDWLGKRKGLTLAGYGLAALTKPFFPHRGLLSGGLCGAPDGPHRQRHSRRAAGRSHCRRDSPRTARRELRPAAGARHCGRVLRTAGCHAADAPKRWELSARLLDRGAARFYFGEYPCHFRSRAGAQNGQTRCPPGPSMAGAARLPRDILVGLYHWQHPDAGAVQRCLSGAALEPARHSRRPGSPRHGGDEYRLRRLVLSGRPSLRPNGPPRGAGNQRR